MIAAVNGYCLGYGLTLVTWCDFVIALRARASSAFPKSGIGVPTIVGAIRLPQRINWQYAMELLLTGERIGADRAKEIGLAGWVVPHDELMNEARSLADRLVRVAPLAARATKEVAVRSQHLSMLDAIRFGETMRRVAGDDQRRGRRWARVSRRSRAPLDRDVTARGNRGPAYSRSATIFECARRSSSSPTPPKLANARRRSSPRAPCNTTCCSTILEQSIEHALGGTFWLVVEGPTSSASRWSRRRGSGAVLAPMPANACHLLAESITIPLRAWSETPRTAAAFAGRWTECHSTAVKEIHGQRLYELEHVTSAVTTPGSLRLAGPADCETLIEWARAFVVELDLVPETPKRSSIGCIGRGQLRCLGSTTARYRWRPRRSRAREWRACSTCTRRLSCRGAGYATACVERMSRVLLAQGLRCVLYTDLGNPTSNAIYRRIGYEAVAEILGYQFA